VKWSFYLGGAVYLIAVLWTILTVREYSPEELEDFHTKIDPAQGDAEPGFSLEPRRYYRSGALLILGGVAASFVVGYLRWDRALYILSLGACFYGASEVAAAWRFGAGKRRGLAELVYDLNNMPSAMKELALSQLFTWFALFAFFIYATAAVTSHNFGSSDPQSEAYNRGANWVGVLMSVYNGVAALVAFLLPMMARRTSRVATHIVCLVIGGIGLCSMGLFRPPGLLIVSMGALGIAWASLLTMPYAILSSVVPYRKMGVYMGMFNFFIVIPQILAAALLGLMVRTVFHGHAVDAIVMGGISMIAAAVLMLRVHDERNPG
jgi:maltose/moltooligosaccharide transporter